MGLVIPLCHLRNMTTWKHSSKNHKCVGHVHKKQESESGASEHLMQMAAILSNFHRVDIQFTICGLLRGSNLGSWKGDDNCLRQNEHDEYFKALTIF